jgi:hypothetical protein
VGGKEVARALRDSRGMGAVCESDGFLCMRDKVSCIVLWICDGLSGSRKVYVYAGNF